MDSNTYILYLCFIISPHASRKSWMLRLGIICRTVSSKDKIFNYLYGQIIECESIQIRHLLADGHKHPSVLFMKTAYFMASEVPLLQWALGVIASKCSCFPDSLTGSHLFLLSAARFLSGIYQHMQLNIHFHCHLHMISVSCPSRPATSLSLENPHLVDLANMTVTY